MWDGYNPDPFGSVYTLGSYDNFLRAAMGPERNVDLVVNNRIEYFNVPASFDIEASSWSTGSYEFNNVHHFATMYIWQFGLNGCVIYGRTWSEFMYLIHRLEIDLELSESRHLVIYVHNLGYEFQWIRRKFTWDKVFAIKRRRPVYAISGGIEFRCSYFLSNYSLKYIGDNLLVNYPIRKLTGNLDYSLVRHSYTPLSQPELAYCFNDVKVVMSYIQEKIENDGDITQIPLTNTGYVRNYCRESCFYEGISPLDTEARKKVQLNYRAIMKSLQVQTEAEYEQFKRAFMGGFTHAGILHSNEICRNVGSADLTSSYPFAMVGQYFPMTRFKYIGECDLSYDFKEYLTTYCCIFDITFYDLRPRVEFENILSASRCYQLSKDVTLNNGRIISCSECTTTLTELDFDNMVKFYEWSAIKVFNLRISHRGYLPKALILAVLRLYESKTSLKGIAGKEIEYLVSKGMINAAFGMMVTAIIRGEFIYDDIYGWLEKSADVEKQLKSYNKNFNRFLYYGWGVWVTAHARHNLFSAIYEFGEDYVYADTDSIKGVNFEDHMDYFRDYNNAVVDSLIKMCAFHNIPYSMVAPKTRKGIVKTIGLWEIEEGYWLFKAVGAKRYAYVYPNGMMQITVGGLNKSQAVPYLLYEYGGGKSAIIEDLCEHYCNEHDIKIEGPAFLSLAKFAYSEPPGASKQVDFAMTFLLQFNFLYENILNNFGEGLCVPAEHTGKSTHDYIDNEFRVQVVDYLGIPAIAHETSAVYMEPQPYMMSITSEYRSLLEGVFHVED